MLLEISSRTCWNRGDRGGRPEKTRPARPESVRPAVEAQSASTGSRVGVAKQGGAIRHASNESDPAQAELLFEQYWLRNPSKMEQARLRGAP